VIDLDRAATAPLRPEARAAMEPFLADRYGNPSAAHALGRDAVRALDEAREELARGMADAVGGRRHRVELASGSLEAMSPEAVLARGFAVVRRASGAVAAGPGAPAPALRDAAGLAPGEELDIRFSRGGASARVLEVRR